MISTTAYFMIKKRDKRIEVLEESLTQMLHCIEDHCERYPGYQDAIEKAEKLIGGW